ncbi:MAG: hypothetical protein QM680_10555 [Luteolibacter sp.]
MNRDLFRKKPIGFLPCELDCEGRTLGTLVLMIVPDENGPASYRRTRKHPLNDAEPLRITRRQAASFIKEWRKRGAPHRGGLSPIRAAILMMVRDGIAEHIQAVCGAAMLRNVEDCEPISHKEFKRYELLKGGAA